MKELSIKYEIYSLNELSDKDQELIQAASASLEYAHAPYSNFHVGSAVRDVNGVVTVGNNQENAAYPSGLCAERVALFAAKSIDKSDLDTIVVLAKNEQNSWADAFPCGSCRQVMMEYASIQKSPIRILMQRSQGDCIVVEDVRDLLPFHFDATQLK